MKRWKVILLVAWLAFVAAMFCGCGGIWADARHSALIDTTAAAAADLSNRAEKADACIDSSGLSPCDCVGEFTKPEIRQILKTNAELWRYFSEAKSGVGTFPVSGLGE